MTRGWTYGSGPFVVPGAPFPVRARRIWAAGTTATDIVALA